MIDFLKAHPNVTRDEYMWEWTVPQIMLASYDFTHIVYLKDRKRKGRKGRKGYGSGSQRTFENPQDFVNALNLPTAK